MKEQITTDLKGISEIFGLPLSSLRKKAAAREFPLIKVGKRRILVSIRKFEQWLNSKEIPSKDETE